MKIPKKYLVIGIIIIVAVAVLFLFFGRSKKTAVESVVAKKTDVLQEVSVTGNIKPAEDVDLALEQGGRVAFINVDVGGKVRAGEVLLGLDSSSLNADLAKAEAELRGTEADLEKIKQGTRPEELDLQQAKVISAENSLDEAKKNMVDKIQDAYTKSDDGVRNQTDQIFSNSRTTSPQLIFNEPDAQLVSDITSGRVLVEKILISWQLSLSNLNSGSNFDDFVSVSKSNLNIIKNFLDKIALAVNTLSSSSNLLQATLDGWKADISTARTNINTATSNLSAADEKLKTAEDNLVLENQQLALDEAGSRPEDVASGEAKADAAKADVENINAQIRDRLIVSPLNGLVTKQDGKVGEIVGSSAPVISLISDSNFEIEAKVPEADIAKVKIGDHARVTLDAYGSDVLFDAMVSKIDPAAVMVEGVATYKVTLELEKKDDRIKSGMTANIDIETARANGVLAVPQRAVISQDEKKFIKILNNDGSSREIEVRVGLTGSDGNVEILSGVKEGDKVVIFSGE